MHFSESVIKALIFVAGSEPPLRPGNLSHGP
jgi:hypothetical protein